MSPDVDEAQVLVPQGRAWYGSPSRAMGRLNPMPVIGFAQPFFVVVVAE